MSDLRIPKNLAEFFHGEYERIAPFYGYRTREESAVPWEDVPENNKKLMIAVCCEVLNALNDQGEAAQDGSITTYIITQTHWNHDEPPCDGAQRTTATKLAIYTGAGVKPELPDQKVWIVDIPDLADFALKEGGIVVEHSGYKEYPLTVEIYNDYRE